MMSLAWIVKSRVVVIPLIFTFMLIGVVTNILQAITLPLWFVRRRTYRKVNTWIIYWFWCVLPWSLESWAGYTIRMYGEPAVERYQNTEHAICLLNHRGDLDWMIGWVLIERAGMLGGTKAMLKESTKYLPLIGWSFWLMEFPMLKRNWKEDEHNLSAFSNTMADYPVNMLLCIFPEGTRFTDEKYEASKAYCEDKGLQPFRHHLYPRTKGFSCVTKNMPCMNAVYDVTFGFRKGEPSLLGVMNAEPCEVDLLIRRMDMKDIPHATEDESSEWLVNLFRDKDNLVDYHKTHGRFPPEYTEIDLPTRLWPKIVVSVWIALLTTPMLLGLCYQLVYGSWIVIGIIIIFLLLVNHAFRKLCKATAERSKHGLSTNNNNKVNGGINGSIKKE